MFAYEICGRALHSEMALPELAAPAAPPAGAPLTFVHRLPTAPAAGWFTIWPRPDGLPWVRAARTPSGYHVRYCNCAEFSIDLTRRQIAGAAVDCAPEMFRHFLVDQVVPLMLSVDEIVLHASAVAIGDGLAAFIGPGGSGKSTIAMALSRHGHAIASDDGLVVVERDGGAIGIPAYAGIRLWPDSEAVLASGLRGFGRPHRRAKQRFRDGLAFAGTEPLTHVYVLSPDGAPAVAFERLSPRDAAVELLQQCFRLALDDGRALATQLDRLTSIARRVPAWRLAAPRALADAPALAAAVARHVQSTSPARAAALR